MKKKVLPPVLISLQTIKDFSIYLQKKERSVATISKYVADLKTFFNFLPGQEDKKLLTEESLLSWRDHLISCNLAARTINTRIAACNNFLCFLKRSDWQTSPLSLAGEDEHPPISREEYCKLLDAARETENERLYFMIKAFCCLGFSLSELPKLTVESIVAGRVQVDTKRRVKNVFIPKSLQHEFLNFANRNAINSGSLFKSQIGAPLTRTLIVKELAELCKIAGIPEEKGAPKKLQELYINTYSDLRAQTPYLIENEFSKIVEQEQALVGWERIAE